MKDEWCLWEADLLAVVFVAGSCPPSVAIEGSKFLMGFVALRWKTQAVHLDVTCVTLSAALPFERFSDPVRLSRDGLVLSMYMLSCRNPPPPTPRRVRLCALGGPALTCWVSVYLFHIKEEVEKVTQNPSQPIRCAGKGLRTASTTRYLYGYNVKRLFWKSLELDPSAKVAPVGPRISSSCEHPKTSRRILIDFRVSVSKKCVPTAPKGGKLLEEIVAVSGRNLK